MTTREFWEEEQKEGARAFLEKRQPDFSRFRRR
jgi:1,4-dihydroxy-2-naphthoyl-CoA synthase